MSLYQTHTQLTKKKIGIPVVPLQMQSGVSTPFPSKPSAGWLCTVTIVPSVDSSSSWIISQSKFRESLALLHYVPLDCNSQSNPMHPEAEYLHVLCAQSITRTHVHPFIRSTDTMMTCHTASAVLGANKIQMNKRNKNLVLRDFQF